MSEESQNGTPLFEIWRGLGDATSALGGAQVLLDGVFDLPGIDKAVRGRVESCASILGMTVAMLKVIGQRLYDETQP